MSLICLCIIRGVGEESERIHFTKKLETLAKFHNRGIKLFVDWSEPIMSCIQEDDFIINILDNIKSDNCELFLLPDGWYCNGRADNLAFKERMVFLREISTTFINRNYCVEFYLAESGTQPGEFFDVMLKYDELVDYLTKTVGVNGVDSGLHISITS